MDVTLWKFPINEGRFWRFRSNVRFIFEQLRKLYNGPKEVHNFYPSYITSMIKSMNIR
jgi:hypothetical protein